MREEVVNWWKQAQKDLESAEKNLEIKEYYLVAFLCQQSVEKALKALYIHKIKEPFATTHSLVFLGKSVGVPKPFYSILRRMNPDFVVARYPDAAYGVPYEMYDEPIAKERLDAAREVIIWVKNQLAV